MRNANTRDPLGEQERKIKTDQKLTFCDHVHGFAQERTGVIYYVLGFRG